MISGWMGAEELAWLSEQASSKQMIVEIGCWMGLTTTSLAKATSGEVYAVDTWQGSEEHKALLVDKEPDWLYAQFLNGIRFCRNVRPCRKTSVDAAALFTESKMKFDMIFIDASHDYENVKADILAWSPILKEGGLLCGHDYMCGWEGVDRAVNELIDSPVQPAGLLWYGGVKSETAM